MVPPPVMMHQGVIRHHSVSRPTSETQERNESSVLFGGLNHAYVQFPTTAQFPLQKGDWQKSCFLVLKLVSLLNR